MNVLTWAQVMRTDPVVDRVGGLRDYVALTKPRVMSLLLLTGGAGAFVGADGAPAPGSFAAMLVGVALACGGASAFNHYLDRNIDLPMGERTASRPVASGRVAPVHALGFGIVLTAASFVLLASLFNLLFIASAADSVL